MPKAVPLSDYTPENIRTVRVFRLKARPKTSPVDINLPALLEESSWNLSDRFRFWHTIRGAVLQARLTIRKLDLDEKALVHCNLEIDGALSILSNNKDYAIRFFRTVFVNSPPAFSGARNWEVRSGWTGNRTTVAFFTGSVAGALGWGQGQIPHEIESSLKEALRGLEGRNWRSCVVMCRRALEALMQLAYGKFFGTKPGKGLDLNGLIRKFELLTPPARPRKRTRSHPRPVPGYSFSKQDAVLAYSNTSAFIAAYFEKISPSRI